MGNTRTAYWVTVTQGVMAGEQGTRLSFRGWGADTDKLKGYDVQVTVEIAEGYELAESQAGSLLLYRVGDGSRGLTAEEARGLGALKVVS